MTCGVYLDNWIRILIIFLVRVDFSSIYLIFSCCYFLPIPRLQNEIHIVAVYGILSAAFFVRAPIFWCPSRLARGTMNSYFIKRLPHCHNKILFYNNTLSVHSLVSFNPFHANVPFLYPLKTSENQRFSDMFRGYRNGTPAVIEMEYRREMG